jgi:predicted nucleotidyltransferase
MVQISVDRESVSAFCRQHHIRQLAFFGSVLRSDFGPDSDIDVLVDFHPDHVPGLFGIAQLERELSTLFGGRKVDLRTAEDLSRYFRQEVLSQAEVQYAEG